VFQSYALFPHMSVADNVAYGLISGGLRKKEAREKAADGLALVGLAGYGERLPSELSGGQQQRVAVARALVVEPQVLLLDEPLSNLDARLRRRVRTEIRELQQRLGFTAVYVTHDQEEALAVSDTVIVMHQGKIAQAGTPRELYEAPASSFIADFIGEANVVPCEVVSVDNGQAHIKVGEGEHRLGDRGLVAGPAKLAIRPNAMTLRTREGAMLAGQVLHAAYLGDHVEYEIETKAGPLFLIDSGTDRMLAPGTDVGIDLHDRGLALVPG
jgi:iron(III) transport system ATP-binding protein